MNASIRLLALGVLAFMATGGPVEACVELPRRLAPKINFPGPISVSFQVGSKGYVELEVRDPGDRWVLPDKGEDEHVSWFVESSEKGKRLYLLAKAAGETRIYIPYVKSDGWKVPPAIAFLHIAEAPPPPPPSIIVDKVEVVASIESGRGFLIRITVPPAPDRHWEVKEAAYYRDDVWQSFELLPEQNNPGVFRTGVAGRQARFVFVQKGDDGQPSTDTVTLLLNLLQPPKC